MRKKSRCLLIFSLLLFIAVATAGYWYLGNTLPIGTGHTAKTLCSNVFIAGRDAATVFKQDIAPIHGLFAVTDYRVDREKKEVISTALGIVSSRAVYRQGCGCTLVNHTDEKALRNQKFMKIDRRVSWRAGPWPYGSGASDGQVPAGVDESRLEKVIDQAFAQNRAPEGLKKTYAVVVAHDGQLIAERYAEEIDARTPLLGWSMSKSVTNALVGILVGQGKLELSAPAPVDQWRDPDDPRRRITLNHLMTMTGGLAFDEAYAPFSDAVEMFYDSYDFAAYAAAKPLAAAPGTRWQYSSGTANIIARIVRQTAAQSDDRYYAFMYRELFDKIGMHSVVFEPDPSGTFVGSSYMFATARDWARFGQLYLQRGLWDGERILPEGWVAYSMMPVDDAPQGKYGAMFWLNAGAPDNPKNRRWPDVPRDAYSAEGFQGQRVIIIPSEKLVIVRLGNDEGWADNKFVAGIIEALPKAVCWASG